MWKVVAEDMWWVGGLDSDKHTTSWPILQAEAFQIFSQAEIPRWTECGKID